MAATSLEAPALSRDTINDVHNLKVQIGAEHAFPVVALDVPVAEVSPLARHFAEFDQEERRSTTAGASTLPVADEPAPRVDEEGTADATSQRLSVDDEAVRSEETSKVSATGNSTADNDAAAADLPSSGVEDASASAGVDVCGVTKVGIADSTAAFGVVDVSALLTEETAVEVSPNVEPPATKEDVRGPRRSLSPGRKGYVNTDASSASPEAAEPAGAADPAGASLQALPGGAEGLAGAADPNDSSPPGNPIVNALSPNKKEGCVIS